jgi:hypothetical protein
MPYVEVKAVSQVLQYKNLYEPMHVHIATNNDASTASASAMTVMWVQKSLAAPRVSYGLKASDLQYTAMVNISSTGEDNRGGVATYVATDFCDIELGLPAGSNGFYEPGWVITAVLRNLMPQTQYFYTVGDGDFGTSAVMNFTTPPLVGMLNSKRSTPSIKWVGFGDLGTVAIDWSKHHSWDWSNDGELYSMNTTSMIAEQFMNGPKEESDFLFHTGDISYAVGFLTEWDDYMHQIEPIASHIPYMTGIGNHEFSWSKEWKPPASVVNPESYGNSDSNGECGVSYNTYFPFSAVNPWSKPTPDSRKPWYAFDYGTVRHVIMSTEHDFSVGSEQYKWIEQTLTTTNRTELPWLMFSGHRPMYVNSNWDGDNTLSTYMIETLEQLLVENKVAVATWGHAHSYSRTCPVINQECQKDGAAPVHIVFGMAGYELTHSVPNPPAKYFEYATNKYYGFMHFTVSDNANCEVKFINSENGDTLDSFTVVNPYQG